MRGLTKSSVLLDENGFLSEEMTPDTTHPSEKGHEVWREATFPQTEEKAR